MRVATDPKPLVRLPPEIARGVVEDYATIIWGVATLADRLEPGLAAGARIGQTGEGSLREALSAEYSSVPHKREFLLALAHTIRTELHVSAVNARDKSHRTLLYMADIGAKFAMLSSVTLHDTDIDLYSAPFASWIGTIELPAMQIDQRPVWMDHAAIFSFLTCESPLVGPWNSIDHPDWLHTKRQILKEELATALGQLARKVESDTPLPSPLSRLTAEYAFIARNWDECLRVLQATRRIDEY
jgi:hypothetical protein